MSQSRDLIAFTDTACVMDEATVRQLATMFDRIVIPPLSFMNNNTYESPEIKKTRAWLVSTGILLELDFDRMGKLARQASIETAKMLLPDVEVLLKPSGSSLEEMKRARGDAEKLAEIKRRSDQVTPKSMFASFGDFEKWIESTQRTVSWLTRIQTMGLRSSDNLDAYAVITREHSSLDHDDKRSPTHDVLKFALAVPVPDAYVPWQNVIEYRNDPESRKQFRTIKQCLSEIAQGSLPPPQAEETLQSLLHSYWQHMQRHHVYIEMKWLEVFVVTTAEVAQKFESSDPRNAGQSWVTIEPRKVALLEGESTTPGSEVAYVIDSKSVFSSP